MLPSEIAVAEQRIVKRTEPMIWVTVGVEEGELDNKNNKRM